MSMVKVISPSGWDFDGPTASIIKMSRDGLRGHDRTAFIKRAASNIFLPYLDNVKFARDEVGVHLIALGASEFYGPNRNGDGFKQAALMENHPSFVKYARFYRNHKNKDPSKSYGIVKLSAYNPAMKRVELLVALNAEKSAADRNGGFIADRELTKLASGEDLCVSMACRVPYDECSFCGHKSPTRDDYCTSSMCKAGGCADNLTRLVKVGCDTHHLHVDNRYPTFFDISDVYRPADRTAWGCRADYLEKAASDHGFMGTDGARLAEDMGLTTPLHVLMAQGAAFGGDQRLNSQIKLACGLSLLSKQALDGGGARMAFVAQPDLDLGIFGDREKTAEMLGALADRKIILTLRDFSRLTERTQHLPQAAVKLAGAIDRMIDDGTLEQRLARNRYVPAASGATSRQQEAAGALVASHSLYKFAVEQRAIRSAIRGLKFTSSRDESGLEKSASDSAGAEDLARDYACYKTAALERIAAFDDEFALTARLAEWQNRAV